MKYFALLIGILIQSEILSLVKAKQIYIHNNFSTRNKSNQFLESNEILLKNKNVFNVKRSNVQMDKYDEVTTYSCKPGDVELQDLDYLKIKGIVENKKCKKLTTCATTIGMLPMYENVECYYAPGKIICKLGKFNFVINNGNHNMTRDIVEKFITMAYERYEEGDNCFDVAVDEVDTTPCACYPTEIKTESTQTPEWNDIPVIVECNLVSNEKLKMCNPNYEPTEKIYQCRAKTMGLNKRNSLNISISDYNGKVSLVKDTTRQIARKKRECINSNRISILSTKKPLKRHLQLHNKFGQEVIPEEDDISNLYYNTKMPCVRNYTDICTLRYQGNMLWCPSFRTFVMLCSNTVPSHLTTTEPCLSGMYKAGKAGNSNADSCTTNSSTMCTVEVTTEPIELIRYNIKLPTRWKRHKYWRRRRKLQPWILGNTRRAKSNHYINGRRTSANIVKSGRLLSLDSNLAEGELQKPFALDYLVASNDGTQTTCNTVLNRSSSDQAQVTSVSTPCSQSTQWCTSVVTIPCCNNNVVTSHSKSKTYCSVKSLKAMNNNSLNIIDPEKSNLIQFKKNTRQGTIKIKQTTNQQLRMENKDHSFLKPQQVKFNQMAMSGIIDPRNHFSRTLGNKLTSSFRNQRDLLYSLNDPYNSRNQLIKMQYRPKRKMLLQKVGRFKRGQIIRRNDNRQEIHKCMIK